MKTYTILRRRTAQLFSAETQMPDNASAIELAKTYDFSGSLIDPNWNNPVCKRIVHIEDENDEIIVNISPSIAAFSATAANQNAASAIDATEIFYWRKHPNMHGWMEKLYQSKDGSENIFSWVHVRLDAGDLDALAKAVRENRLPHTQGFFFGASDGTERADDEHFIRKARDAIAKGKRVYYTSWW